MTKEEIIFKVLQAVWLTTSAVLIVVLHVYRGRGLAKAPVRESTLTLGSSIALAGGVFFLYLCSQAIAFAVAKAMLPGGGRVEGEVRSIQMMVNISAVSPIIGIGLVAVMILAARFIMVGGVRAWGASLRQLPQGLGWGVLGWFMVIPWLVVISQLIEMLLAAFDRELTVHPTLVALRGHLPTMGKMILALSAGIAAPIIEEFLFRGVIQTALVQRLGEERRRGGEGERYVPSPTQRWIAIIITSVIFAGIHLMADQFLVLFVLSLALGYVYERTGNLWAAVGLHAVFNCVNLAALLWPKGA